MSPANKDHALFRTLHGPTTGPTEKRAPGFAHAFTPMPGTPTRCQTCNKSKGHSLYIGGPKVHTNA